MCLACYPKELNFVRSKRKTIQSNKIMKLLSLLLLLLLLLLYLMMMCYNIHVLLVADLPLGRFIDSSTFNKLICMKQTSCKQYGLNVSIVIPKFCLNSIIGILLRILQILLFLEKGKVMRQIER